MILTGEKLEVVPYLYGPTGCGKSIFMALLRKLGQGNESLMSMSEWNSKLGKASGQGARCLLFDDADSTGLTDSGATDIKRYVSGQELLIKRKGSTASALSGGIIVMTASQKFTYKKARSTMYDAGWLRRLLTIPLGKENNLVRDKKLLTNLLEDSGGLIGWVLAFPQDSLNAIGSNAEAISNHLEKGLSNEGIDNLCKDFFSETFVLNENGRILAGHSATPNKETATSKFCESLRDREFPIPKGRYDIKQAFARAIENLGLGAKVTHRRGNQGWAYHGISLWNEHGAPIVIDKNPGICLLLNTPVFTWVGKNKKLDNFDCCGMSSNKDLIEGNQPNP